MKDKNKGFMFTMGRNYQQDSVGIDVDACAVQHSRCSCGKGAEIRRCQNLLVH